MGSNDFSSPPTHWRRIARTRPIGKDVAGLLGRELRHVFSVATVSSDLKGARRLLEAMDKKRQNGR
jgi:hypothetical protein